LRTPTPRLTERIDQTTGEETVAITSDLPDYRPPPHRTILQDFFLRMSDSFDYRGSTPTWSALRPATSPSAQLISLFGERATTDIPR
jgi:hypothetical protein